MAPNRLPEARQQHDSSSEEKEEDEEDNSSGSTEPIYAQNDSSSEEEKEEDHDSSSEEEKEEDEEDNSSGSTEPIYSNPTPAAMSSGAALKRPAAESNRARDSKRAKKDEAVIYNNGNADKSGDDTRKERALFQRVWSDVDEVAILEGLMDFRANKGYDPMTDLNAFRDFIKESLEWSDASKSQFCDKVRRMKRKYFKKRGKDGQDPTFADPHERRTYDLSRKIWGEEQGSSDGLGVGNGKEDNGNGRPNEKGLPVVDEELADIVEEGARSELEPDVGAMKWVDLNIEEVILKHGLDFISGPKKLELMEKWRQLRVEEVDLYLRRLDLVQEQAKLVLKEKWRQLRVEEVELYLGRLDLVQEQAKLVLKALKN